MHSRKPLPISRRQMLTVLGGVVTGLGLAATAEPGETAAWSTSRTMAQSASTSSAPAPVKGGTLRFGNIGDLQTLEGQTIGANGAYDHLYSVWDRLIVTDPKTLEIQPMLAESWDIADNSQRFTFSLRRGVLFHTGRELTADDVKWSLMRIQDPKTGSVLTGRITPMIAIETPDKYTVVVMASRPWVEAFDLFEQATILDPVTFGTDGISRPTGTGPFMFAEYSQGDHLRLVRNSNYWRSDLPYLDEILVTIHRDAQAAVVALEAGAIDIITVGLPIPDLIRLQGNPNYTVLLNDHSARVGSHISTAPAPRQTTSSCAKHSTLPLTARE
jgi:peptide/nickel transport system substrate-binding protein